MPSRQQSNKDTETARENRRTAGKRGRLTSEGLSNIFRVQPVGGTSSRAYANTHGSQAGLGIPDQVLGAAANRPSNVYKAPSGRGIGMNPVAAAMEPPPNPYESAYDQLISRAQGIGTQNLADIDEIKKNIGTNYNAAEDQLYGQYKGSRADLDAAAVALGVGGADIYHQYDAALRRIQENSDQSQAQDESWFDKMKALRGTELDSLYQALTNEKAMQMANWQIMMADRAMSLQGGGGGSSGRGGGSGSGSGNISQSETAQQVDTLNPWWDQALYDSLSPSQQATYKRNAGLNSGNTALAGIINEQTAYQANAPGKAIPVKGSGFNATAKKVVNEFTSKVIAANKANNIKSYDQLINAVAGTTGGYGVPTSTRKVTTTGKSTKKIARPRDY